MQPIIPPAEFASLPKIQRTEKLRDLAQDLEATFLSEMLKHAGLGEAPESFGGGIGEEQYGSLLRDMQAKEIAAAGGIGLSEAIFKSLKEKYGE